MGQVRRGSVTTTHAAIFAQIMMVLAAEYGEEKTISISAKIPLSLHRFQRL